jgi:hypothetical protein
MAMRAQHVSSSSPIYAPRLDREAERKLRVAEVTPAERAGALRGLAVAMIMALPFWIALYLLLR